MNQFFKQITILDPFYSNVPENVKEDIRKLMDDYGSVSNGLLQLYYPIDDKECDNRYPALTNFCIENGFPDEVHIWLRW